MIRSLYTAATGMKANQLYVDNISNNLSNVNTSGFKKSKIEFEDLIYQSMQAPGSRGSDGSLRPVGVEIGLGTRIVANQKLFMQGNLESTGNQLDVAIQGDGFFQIQMPNGETAFSRHGAFKLSDDGSIVTAQGYYLEPQITIPSDSQQITISDTGVVAVRRPGQEVQEEVGQIELVRFMNPGGLESKGQNLYMQSEASGMPMAGIPGEENLGVLKNQFLEASNVQMVEEMVNMIIAQRAYEISSKAISTSDEMLQTASQLKR